MSDLTIALPTFDRRAVLEHTIDCYLKLAARFPLLVIDDGMRRGILEGLDASSLHTRAIAAGMHTLYEDGLRKVADGVTSLDELLRVTEVSTDA